MVLILSLLITGCGSGGGELQRGLDLRSDLLKSQSCTFDAKITADYGDKLFEFTLSCQGDAAGNVAFAVAEPETIAGITGKVAESGGTLTFDGTALAFPHMADDQITPVMAPWVLLRSLRSGYLTSAGTEGELLRLSLDDSYEEDALHLDVWLDEGDMPIRAEILYDGRRLLSMVLENWQIR